MNINDAGVMMVNAKLNMNKVRKELDLFFNTTVKKIKTNTRGQTQGDGSVVSQTVSLSRLNSPN